MSDIEFERSKIYEKLDYTPEPPGYKGKLPWAVQQQIAATNGIQYMDQVGKLRDYPRYRLPVDEVDRVENALMLDIGCGWGRWLVGGSEKGYIPVGIDLRLEFCQAAKQTLTQAGVNGYTVVADLKEFFACGRVENAHRVISAAGRDARAIGRKGRAEHSIAGDH